MAKISSYPDGGPLQATDEVFIARAGTNRRLTGDALAEGIRIFAVLVNDDAPLTTGNGKAYFTRIPAQLNGWNIIAVAANRVSGTGVVTIQIYNLTQTADILSTEITIDDGDLDSKDAAAPAVIDAAQDDLQTGDRLRVDVDGAGTTTTWLDVQFVAQKAP